MPAKFNTAHPTRMRQDDRRHGTVAGYHRGCRCQPCKTANSTYMRDLRERKLAALQPEDHGKYGTYVNCNCRCEPCREANRNYNRQAQNSEQQRNRYKMRTAPKVKLSDLA